MKKFIFLMIVIMALSFTSCSFLKKTGSGKKTIVQSKQEEKSKTSTDLKPKEEEVKRVHIPENDSPSTVYYTGKAVVLTYHHISSVPFSGITVKPERFESDMNMLKDKGFNVITMRKLINAMQGSDKLPPNAVVISFDDGIESFYKYAYPVLKKYIMPAVSFVITSRVESYSPSKDDFNPLSAAEIKEMYDSGLIDIQSHTHNSHDGVVTGPDKKVGGAIANKIYYPKTKTYETEEHYESRVLDDLNKSSQLIESYTGVKPDMLCFPFGQYKNGTIDLCKRAGFNYFITTVAGANYENSKSHVILRIRSGDSNLSTDKLFNSIINTGKSNTKK